MAFGSDVSVNASKFQPCAIPAASHEFNKQIMSMLDGHPKWWQTGAEAFREMIRRGETAFPIPPKLDCGQSFMIPSREAGRNIPCRVIKPSGDSTPSGVFLHFHGSGWVLSDELSQPHMRATIDNASLSQDPLLKHYADAANLVSISIAYRLAPEHPFPAAPEDCYDAAEWLVDNAEKAFGAPLQFIGGESAGGHLSALAVLHLLSHQDPKYSDFKLRGLLVHYGAFDLSYTPTMFTYQRSPSLVLDRETMSQFTDAFVPDPTLDRKHPSISPLYFNFRSLTESGKSLPPALFTCGTEDILLDDTVFMTVKWQMAGGEAVARIVPGAPHGFIGFPPAVVPGVQDTLDLAAKFLKDKTGRFA
ncbi:predicted protein [Uncinocarpus reesii 1704]|uniref:Alpha/beta hydrolase fold-3 domain-containing protein n=1 Tax=Uncinocarpus reesii (strain UAMH 1704) TaxID=336963 RepID=C4JNF6_UNCRE|nr:uncharacterized protein UREG_04362 [Uncinocarpus reesii 1704]EEP79516.1 predicted protein [Uncinocarpus reesii 1704]